MKKILISADSPADIPEEMRARYDIRTVPLHVVLEEKSYLDGEELTAAQMLEAYGQTGVLPKTSAVSILEYRQYFEALLQEAEAVVHISLSSQISSTHQNAVLAAEGLPVWVVDSKRLCTGMALLCRKAAELAETGCSAQVLAHELEYQREKVVTTFILDKLDFLYKGGRCSGVAALGANLLGIKPAIVMPDGTLSVGKKYRGKIDACQKQYVQDLLTGPQYAGKIDKSCVCITHTVGMEPNQLKALQKEVQHAVKFKEVYVSEAGCTITSHCGKNTFSVEFMVV